MFAYAIILAIGCSLLILRGFARRSKLAVAYGVLLPCFSASPIVTFTRGAAGAITATDVTSFLLLFFLLLGYHRRWPSVPPTRWYKALKILFFVMLLQALVVAPIYNWKVLMNSPSTSNVSGAGGAALPILMAGFDALKLCTFAAVVYLFARVEFSDHERSKIIRTIVFACCILAAGIILTKTGVVDLALSTTIQTAEGARVFGINRAPQGRMLLLAILLGVFLFAERHSVPSLAAILLLIVAMCLTGSRAAILGAGCTVLCFFLIVRHYTALIVVLFAVPLAFAAFSTTTQYSQSPQRILRIFQDRRIRAEAGSRPQIWADMVTVIGNHPLVLATGVGPFNLPYGIDSAELPAEHAHNDWLTCLIETGIIGLSLLLLSYFFLVADLLPESLARAGPSGLFATCLLSALAGLFFASLFETTLYISMAGLPVHKMIFASCAIGAQWNSRCGASESSVRRARASARRGLEIT